MQTKGKKSITKAFKQLLGTIQHQLEADHKNPLQHKDHKSYSMYNLTPIARVQSLSLCNTNTHHKTF